MPDPLSHSSMSHPLWDLLPDVAYWEKDRDGRFLWINHAFTEQAQATRESIIGTLDSDWFFNALASVYMYDDMRVLETGEPLINKLELVMNIEGWVEWCATSKFPRVDSVGEVCGTYGMSRPVEHASTLPTEYVDLAKIVSHARAELAHGVTVEGLAAYAHLSLSTLERYVRRHLRITPQELLQRIRMNRARRLLTGSTMKIGEIAHECGYESFSSFSRAFRTTFGCPPGQLRAYG